MESFLSHIVFLLTKQTDTKSALVVFSLIMSRMVMIVNLVPFLGGKNAPGPVKIGIGILLSVVLWPHVAAHMTAPMSAEPIEFVLLMLKEIFVGFSIGFVSSEIFYTVEMTGQLVDVFRATNQIQLMVPELQERSSAWGSLNYQLLLVIFLTANLHGWFFEALVDSFVYVPVDGFPLFSYTLARFADQFIHLLSHIFLVSVTLAAPVGIVCLIIDIAFGLMNRVAPQINAYFLSMPAKALGGLVISFAAFSLAIRQYEYYAGVTMTKLFEVIQLFR